jgi:hypothetical protein
VGEVGVSDRAMKLGYTDSSVLATFSARDKHIRGFVELLLCLRLLCQSHGVCVLQARVTRQSCSLDNKFIP